MAVGYTVQKLVTKALNELGRGATHEQVLLLLKQENAQCSYGTYQKHYRRMFVETPPDHDREMTTDEPVIAVRPVAEAERSLDGLSTFIRFAVAVEQAGGVQRARDLLEVMEKIGGLVERV